jgi:hypothetical protein
VGQIVAAKLSARNHLGDPFVGNRLADRVKHAEVKKHLQPAEIDAWSTITLVGGQLRITDCVSTVAIQLTSTT